MKSLDWWLTTYAQTHQNPTNKVVHKLFVPIIMLSILGLISLIPVLDIFPKDLNWAHIFSIFCLAWYLSLSPKFFAIMLGVLIAMLAIIQWVNYSPHAITIWSVLFLIGWIFQFWGHKIEGKKPSFFQDLQFLLVGPLWVIKDLLKLKT